MLQRKHIVMVLFIGVLYSTQNEINFYADSWALLIGINDYQNVRKLHYAVEDAMAIKIMLINEHGFPRDNVRYLIDESATQLRINKELSNLVKSVGKNDRVVFYFAGHGDTRSMGLEEGDIGFLIPVDGDAEDLYLTSLPMDEVKNFSDMTNYFVQYCSYVNI